MKTWYCECCPRLSIPLFSLLFLALTACNRGNDLRHIPAGYVDSPASGTALSGTVNMRGWAADEDGVSKVCVYIDRRLTTCTEDISAPRPDVAAAWPNIGGSDRSGWTIQLNTDGARAGDNVIVVQAVSKSGATRDIGTLNVSITK